MKQDNCGGICSICRKSGAHWMDVQNNMLCFDCVMTRCAKCNCFLSHRERLKLEWQKACDACCKIEMLKKFRCAKPKQE